MEGYSAAFETAEKKCRVPTADGDRLRRMQSARVPRRHVPSLLGMAASSNPILKVDPSEPASEPALFSCAPTVMLNAAYPEDFVEDLRRAPMKDCIINNRGNTLPDLGSLIDRRKYQVGGSDGESDEDVDLENHLLEEMDTMERDHDSDKEGDSDECLEIAFDANSCEQQVRNVCTLGLLNSIQDTCTTLEWSQFMGSGDRVLRYMKKATAEALDASGLKIPSMHEGDVLDGGDAGEVAEKEQEDTASSIGALISNTTNSSCSDSGNPGPAMYHNPSHMEVDPTAGGCSIGDASRPKQDGSNEVKLLVSVDLRSPLEHLGLATRQPVTAAKVSPAERSAASENGGDVEHVGFVGKLPGASLIPHNSSVSVSSGTQAFRMPNSRALSDASANGTDARSVSIPAAPLLASIISRGSTVGGPSVRKEPLILIDVKDKTSARAVGFALESPHVPELEADCISSRLGLEESSRKPEKDCVCTEGGISAVAKLGSPTDVIASVGEAEVARRVRRGKTLSVDARRQRREKNVERSRLEGSLIAFQAIWRGSCIRVRTAPAIADRRREAEEKRRMLQEERLAQCVVALEAQQHHLHLERQLVENHLMRCEEKRTHAAWLHSRRLEETVRGEELVRMRAEERLTRALLDLALQDLQRVETANREERERAGMQSEDLAMRDLKRVTEAQSVELASMGIEDVLARASRNFEGHQLSLSRAETCLMVVEDHSSSAWNTEDRCQLRRRIRQAWAKSTPIQRAMDPEGTATARALAYTSSPNPHRQISFVAGPKPATELAVERARRRENCKHHLRSVYAGARQVRRDFYRAAATSKTLENTKVGPSSTDYACSGSQDEAALQRGQISPVKGRAGPAERDGAERELAMDMLLHLGPMKDLTELDLSVEGLTSASLLRACTSLKSLSLNVNRLSSPAGLVESTSLVRLGLRDNRLSSLQGLSGLPCLRELRLDINHLTSLHELKRLPALVELSANTNHIQELPEGFAIGLMSAEDPLSDQIQSPPASVERVVACGGLQKLELYHNRIKLIHPKALQGLGSLTHLDLGRNQLRTLNGQGLESCPALSTLILSQNLLREPPFPLCLPLLNELWLSGNQISSMGAWASRSSSEVLRCPSSRNGSKQGELLDSPDSIHGVFRKREPQGRGSATSCGLDNDSEGGVQDETAAGEEDGNHSDISSVWLPSLEALHLQDNALETLGGCLSLAGCPFLRSVDASFNQFRRPDEVAVSLRVCSGLEEIRLHDNPASLCHNYTDAIAVSCPHLKRIDGILVDTQAHWRAGLNTYGRRADLVLPFLLSTDGGTEIHEGVGCSASPSPSAAWEPTDDRASESPASNIHAQSCPWCGAARPRISQANETVINPKRENSSVGGLESIGEDAWEVDHPVFRPRLPQRMQDCVREDMSSGRSACASCGLTFPQTELWSVPESSSACFSVKWDDVCSTGDHWRGRIAEGLTFTETDESHTFRAACLRGRDEHARLKHRHRREERELAAKTALYGEESRPLNGGVDRMSRLGPVAPSKRRLEGELELGEQHSKERKELAVRHLRFHEDGVYRGGADCIDITCTVPDVKPDTLKQDHHVCDCLYHDGGGKIGDVLLSPVHPHNSAAVIIQRLWQRRRDRGVPPLAALPALDKDRRSPSPMKEEAVTKLQSAFRGFHVRRALQAALESSRYVDDELESLLNMDGGARFELDHFLSPPPELRDGWWRDSSSSEPEHVSRAPSHPSRAKAEGERLVDTPRFVVNTFRSEGTHSTEGSDRADMFLDEHGGQLHSVGTIDQGGERSGSEADCRTVTKTRREENASAGTTGETIQVDFRGGCRRGARIDLGRAWGLNDPTVVRSMVKRAKRLRMFRTSEARREKLKDPTVRLKAFVRNAGEHERKIIASCRSGRDDGLGAHCSGESVDGKLQGSRASAAMLGNTRRTSIDRRVRSVTSEDDVDVRNDSVARQIARGPVKPTQPTRANRHARRGGSSLLVPWQTARHATLSAHDLGCAVSFKNITPRLASEERQPVIGGEHLQDSH